MMRAMRHCAMIEMWKRFLNIVGNLFIRSIANDNNDGQIQITNELRRKHA